MQRLHAPQIECKVSWKVLDKNGEVISEGAKGGDICLENFAKVLMAILSASDDYTAVDTNGTSFNIRGSSQTRTGVVKIAFGTGTTTPTKNDYALASEYERKDASCTWEQDDTNKRYILRFTATFTPSEAVTVAEVGLLQIVYDTGGSTHWTFYFRDLIGPEEVPAGGGFTVTYELYISFGG